jgi:folate-binding protein YgfZ
MSGELPVRQPRDLVVVEGPDALTYLQGQLSQDVAGLEVGERSWSLVLQPKGRVEAWVGVARSGPDRVDLDIDAGWAEALVARLSRFLIRTDATIRIEAASPPPAVWATALERARITAGVPAMGAELDGRTIAAEVGDWFVDRSVSFTKGCYVGQELVVRVRSRGSNVPRRLWVISFDDPGPAVGATVVRNGDAVGSLTSVADGVALGFLRRDVGPSDPLEVADPGGRSQRVRIAAGTGQ